MNQTEWFWKLQDWDNEAPNPTFNGREAYLEYLARKIVQELKDADLNKEDSRDESYQSS